MKKSPEKIALKYREKYQHFPTFNYIFIEEWMRYFFRPGRF
jgi:hypothetical protein